MTPILHTSDDTSIQNNNRCLAVTQIQNHLSRIKSNRYKDPLQAFSESAIRETKRFLAQNPNLCVLESDKGKRMVIMEGEEYERKMHALLDDSAYKILTSDPTPGIERKTNKHVARLLSLKLIDEVTAKRLTTKTSTCPRIYGQPKAHKANLPLRPVVPNITAPTYQLSKYLANILQSAHNSKFNIQDSFTFVEKIKNVTLPPEYVLVSFDVVSLFTNIPKLLVVHDVIENWKDIQHHTDIDLSHFLELIEFCLDNSYFSFRGKFYLQTFGTAMGSPISPILADVVMETLLLNILRLLDFEVPVLYKYVDDLLIALPKTQIQHTLEVFNNFNQHLQFTKEEEEDGRIPFLDTVVTRNDDQTISTHWYSKPIASGRLLNYLSFHPTTLKMNVAANFIHRVTALTTDQPLQQQKQVIFKHLRLNNYPSSLINRLLTRIQHLSTANPGNSTLPLTQNDVQSTTDSGNQSANQPVQPIYRSLPYIPFLTPSLTNIFKNDFPNLKIANKTIRTNSKLLRNVRDPINPLQKSKVIYSIPCKDCQMVYIGKTKNKLQTRLYGHQSDVNKLTRIIDRGITNIDEQLELYTDRTALIEHSIVNQHAFDLSKIKIVDNTFKISALSILEMCHITNTPNTVNHRTDVDGLSTTYSGILHTIKSNSTRRNRTAILDSQNPPTSPNVSELVPTTRPTH